jgi:hypothetical protein
VELNEDLVNEKSIAIATVISAQSAAVLRSESIAPKSNGFMRDGDRSLGQEIFDISMAQIEPEIEPDSVSNDFWRKSVALIQADVFIHPAIVLHT